MSDTVDNFLAKMVRKLLLASLKQKEYSHEELEGLLMESLDLLKKNNAADSTKEIDQFITLNEETLMSMLGVDE